MNERIKELWNKAGGDYWDSNQMGSYYHINNPEKFAELIVKECAGVAEVSMPINSYPDDRLTVKNNVLKHFGVTE